MRPAVPTRFRQGLLRGLFAVGLAAFGLALAFGGLHALRAEGRLPAVDAAYGLYLERLFEDGDRARALSQLRTAAALDFESRRQILPVVVALAREEGDAETERWGLRELLVLYPRNEALHRSLEEAEARDR